MIVADAQNKAMTLARIENLSPRTQSVVLALVGDGGFDRCVTLQSARSLADDLQISEAEVLRHLEIAQDADAIRFSVDRQTGLLSLQPPTQQGLV